MTALHGIQEIYALSPLQRGMLFHTLYSPESAIYNIQLESALEGDLDERALEEAWRLLVVRYSPLRTSFVWERVEKPYQVVHGHADLKISRHDWRTLEGAAQEECRQRVLRADLADRFELTQPPLMRLTLILLGARKFRLIWTFHHIILEGWSAAILLNELWKLYASLRSGRPPDLPAVRPYGEYIRWLGKQDQASAEAYWREALRGFGAANRLSIDRLPGNTPAAVRQVGSCHVALPQDLTDTLRRLARTHRITLNTIVQGAWSILLNRYSGEVDVTFGAVMSGRPSDLPGVESIVGLFVNTLPARVTVEANEELIPWLQKLQLAQATLRQYEYSQLMQVQGWSDVPAGQPLFHTALVFQNWLGEMPSGETVPGLRVTQLHVHEASDQPLTLSVETRGAMTLTLIYDVERFERAAVQRFLTHCRVLLEEMTTHSQAKLGDLSLLTDAERRQVLEEWTATGMDYPRESGIAELFEAQAACTPDAVALEFEGAELSYGELNARANRLAHYLKKQGVTRETLVGLCVERGLEMVVATLAILKAGGAYVPLDPEYPASRLAFMLEDTQAPVLLTQERLRERLPQYGGKLIALDTDWGAIGRESAKNPKAVAGGQSLAYVIYTSGSTGTPKGVQVTQRAVNRLVCNTDYIDIRASDRFAQVSVVSFDAATFEIWGALLHGARVVSVSREVALSPREFSEFLRTRGITVLFLTTALFNQMAREAPGAFGALRYMLFGGEAVDAGAVRAVLRDGAPEHLLHVYGPTEVTTYSTWQRVSELDEAATTVPIGRPIANTTAYVLDERRCPVPVGVPGELYLGGDGVARGYLNRPELTAERFVEHPYSEQPGTRLYRTGDWVRYLPDGAIEFIGRRDGQVKVHGFRIELGEIEAALGRLAPVREAVVVVREDTPGDKRVVAYVVAKEGQAEALADLRNLLKQRLPDYMVPAAFVTLDTLPLTPNGKVDRRALPAPEYTGAGEYVAPRDATEESLARIWAELLKVERVGVHDNFFELGGHSLLAVTLIERMRRAGLNADVRALFTAPTLAGLAQAVAGESDTVAAPANGIPPECEAITPQMLPLAKLTPEEIGCIVKSVPGGAANIQDIYALAPLQEGILFHHLMAREGDIYLLRAFYGFDTRTRLNRYLQALQAVINRHDILRTGVMWEGLGEPVQVVWRKAPLVVEEVNLDPAQGDVAEQLRARFDPRSYRLDVSQAPLVRVVIAEDAINARWVMLLLFHHLAIDHTALEVMQQEIQAYLLGQEAKLPMPLPFRNFVAQARLGVPRAEHEAYFKQLLGDVDEPTAPFGLADVQGEGAGVVEVHRAVDARLAKRLREKARALGVSAASLCHLAYAQVLARTSGREDVVFGTVLFGRMQGGEGAERVMGLFINTLPVRIRVGEAGVEESVRQTHAQLAQLLRHEHAPLALAQRCSAVAAPAPLFSALLNYRHSAVAAQAASSEARRAWEGVKALSGEERTNYPVVLSVDDLGEGFGLTAQVQSPVDAQRICGYMHRALEELVEALERAPATAVRALDVLPEPERRQLLNEWNDTKTQYPAVRCVHEWVEEQARSHPQALAVQGGTGALSYRELVTRAEALAARLRARGVGAGSLVAVYLERSVEMVVALLAVWKAGGAYVPIDPEYPPERVRFMLEDSGAPVVVTQGSLAGALPASGAAVLRVEEKRAAGKPRGTGRGAKRAARSPDELAYVIYTSGSTGQPKGVRITHASLCNLICWHQQAYGLTAADRATQLAGPAFDASVWELWPYLTAGASVHLPDEATRLDPGALVRWLVGQRITVSFLPTPLAEAALRESWPKSTALRVLLTGGDRLNQRPAQGLPFRLVNHYGPTENTVVSTCAEVQTESTGVPPIGRPLPNTRAYVLDAHLNPVPVGVPGELLVGGVQLAAGYLNRAELTQEKFIADPFEPGSRLYRTGDIVRYTPEGNIEFLGRIDTQVKVRGFRIELGEIESALGSHPAIRESVVLAREDSPGDKRLVAYVVATDPPADLTERLRAHLRVRLPEYMVPVAFVALEALPLTRNGKVDRKALPAPEYTGAGEYVAPRNATEESLARIWAEVLKVERVGVNDNFFELGGHSLLAVTLVERMRRAGLNADVRALFTAPTLAELAKAVGGESGTVAVPANGIPPGCEAITPEMLPLAKLTPDEIGRIVSTVPGGAANVQDIYPLAPLQEGILFHHLMAREGDPYLLRALYSVDTRARLDNYLGALRSVIDRHDILRTGVVWEGLSEPVQVVWRKAPLVIEEVKLDAAAGDIAGRLAERFDPRRYRVDIGQAPLLRAFIAEDKANSRWVMLFLVHHLAIDHTALEVVQQEIQAHLLGEGAKLPKSLPFRNFVAQARLGVPREEHEGYFKKLLGDVDEPTAPFGVVDVRGDGSGITEARLAVDRELARRLRARARALGVSAASLCHLAYAQVLARTSGREDVVFGTVLFGRMQGGEGAERVLGLFINTLPVRIRVGEAGVEESVRSTHAQLAQLLRHEHASLALAQRASGVAAPAPLFSALLNYRHSAGAAQAASSEARQAWEGIKPLSGEERTNYPLTLSVDDLGEGLALTAQVQSPIDPARICAYMHGALEQLVVALESSPTAPLSTLDVLPASERRQLLEEWTATGTDYPARASIAELFEAQAKRAPQAVALECEGEELTYKELNARANRLAHYLAKQGVRRETRVGLCVERSVEMVVATLAILKAGGAYVPLDPEYPEQRLAFMLEDTGAPVLLTQERLRERLPAYAGKVIALDTDWKRIARASGANPKAQASGASLAYVIYTSGSTGRPKGTLIEQKSVVRLVRNTNYLELTPEEVFLQFAPISFDASTLELWGPLLNGGRLVLAPAGRLSLEELARVIKERGITTLWLTAALFNQMVDSQPEALKGVRQLLAGGEALSVPHVRRFLEGIGKNRLINGYGPTENTTFTCCHVMRAGTPLGPTVPIGRAISNSRVYILDSQRNPVPVGVVGELYIGGAGLARGYLNQPELTAEKFVPDPFNSGERLYRTGDLVRYTPEGVIEFQGRADTQVKVRGFRIELGEIESALGSHPALRETVVLAREDTPGDKRLVAYVVATDPPADLAERLRAHLRATLPEYMVPSAFVVLDALPLTPNGKVDRKALPAPEYTGAGEYVAPRNATEEKLAAIWAEVLKVERVGIHDNFFELGGHSLLAVTLIERMRRAGLNADVRALFTTPTLAELAAAVGGESDTVAVPANAIPANCEAITPEMLPLISLTAEEIGRIVNTVPGGAPNIQDIYPLAPLQEGILFHHLMAREGDPYLLHSLVAFDTRARLDGYLKALQAVIDRHDILRTGVVWEGLSEPVQVVWRSAPLAIEEVSLNPASGDIAEQLRARFDPRRYRLEVSQAPLLRVFLAEDRVKSRWMMLFVVHHLAIDHTALEVVQQEIRQIRAGEAAELPKPLPFRNFVAQARLGVAREEHEAYFRKLLGDVDEPTAPFGLVDVQGDGSGITEASLPVDERLARKLRERARALGVSAASVCHLAYAQVLARVSGRDDVVFGTVLFGRMQGGEGAERVMGLFINTLPVRVRAGKEGVAESVRAAHTQLAQLLRHEHASLALAQRCSSVAAPAPLFSSFLNYRHTPTEQRSAAADQAMAGIEVLAGEARSNYPLQFSIDDHGGGFTLTAKVKTPVDPKRICNYMHTALEHLVVALDATPAAPLHRLDVLPEAERDQLLVEWNDTTCDYRREARIHRLIEQQVAATPDAVALEFEEQTLTYGEMNGRANQLARFLRRKGVRPDVLVGVFADRSIEMVVALLAILKSGGAYVPLDPSYPAERLAHMLEDTRAPLVLAQRHLASQLPSGVAEVHLLDPSWVTYADEARDDPEDIGAPRDLAYVIFTSGSTGRPKGAMNEHRGVCNRLLWLQEEFGLTGDDCIMQKTAISFDPSVREFFWPLLAGARLVIARPEGHLDTAYLVDLIRRRRITQLQFVPSMLRVFIEQEGVEACGSLKRVFCSGEALTHELQERFFTRLPGVELHNLYGPTECSMTVGYWACRRGDGSYTVPIGRPGSNIQLYVLDASLRPAPIGVAGELHIGGIQVGRGYAGRPDLTAERFIEDPFSAVAGARLYKTGDLVRYRNDGAIEYLGRADFQVKFRGFRVELGEVEATLDTHPAVAQSVVIVREDNPGDQRLVAYVVARETAISAADLKQHLSQQLPQYMVPGTFVFLQALPLTSSGKVDRKALRAPDRSSPDESAYVAPRTDTERALAGIWAGLLGVERVGVHDDFFALGGHSLLATQVVSRVRQALGVELPVRELFGASTVEALSAVVDTLARVGKANNGAIDQHDSEEFVV